MRRCLGSVATALLLVGGPGAPWRMLFSCWPLRWIGRISYSVYLVHWPLICLYRYWSIVTLTQAELWMLCAASLFLGAGQYVFVEKIFRLSSERKLPQLFWMTGALRSIWSKLDRILTQYQERIFALFLIISRAALCFAAAIITRDGFPERMMRGRVQQASGELSFAGDICNSSRSRCTFGAPTSTQVVVLPGGKIATPSILSTVSTPFSRNGTTLEMLSTITAVCSCLAPPDLCKVLKIGLVRVMLPKLTIKYRETVTRFSSLGPMRDMPVKLATPAQTRPLAASTMNILTGSRSSFDEASGSSERKKEPLSTLYTRKLRRR